MIRKLESVCGLLDAAQSGLSEQHAASIFKVGVSRARMFMSNTTSVPIILKKEENAEYVTA